MMGFVFSIDASSAALGVSFNNGNWKSSFQIMRNRVRTQVLPSRRIKTGNLDPTVVRYSSIIANAVQVMYHSVLHAPWVFCER